MFLQKLKEIFFGKPKLPTFENGIPASGAYSGMPKTESIPAAPQTVAEQQDTVNDRLAKIAKEFNVAEQTVINKAAAVEQAVVAKVAKIRKPRAKKPD